MHSFPGLFRFVFINLLACAVVVSAAAVDVPPTKPRLVFTTGHGEPTFSESALRRVVQDQGGEFHAVATPVTDEVLAFATAVWIQMPTKSISAAERSAISAFVTAGGALFLAADEEKRQPLAVTGVNDLLNPFGLTLTADTPYMHNRGALAPVGAIIPKECELPYSGGRAVTGGTPFSFLLGQDGKPIADAHGAYTVTAGGGRVIALAEGMAPLFLGRPDGTRLTGVDRDPKQTVYWGKDSMLFNRAVVAWLFKREKKS